MTQSKAKGLITKYLIEFFVIVFSITVSFLVENTREEIENDKKRYLIKTSLLEEIKSFENRLNGRIAAFKGDYNALMYVLDDNRNLDTILNNLSSGGFANPFFISRSFRPPNSIYNSLVNDGDINLLKSTKIKSLLEMTYVQVPKRIGSWEESESIIGNKIESYVIKNYPKFYNKEIYFGDNRGFFNSEGKSIVNEFILMINTDEQLKALIKSKTPAMINRNYILNNLYVKYRDSLIIELEKELKIN